MKKIQLGLLLLFGTACQSYPPETDVRYIDDSYLDGTVSVVDSFPAENAVDVPTDIEVTIDFSDRIKTASISDNFNFQVEDEFGIPVEGRVYFDKDDKRIRFQPRYRSKRSNLNRATTYTVHARYIQDYSGYLIGSFSFQFRTVNQMPNTGSFYIKNVFPEERLVFPGQQIAVQFSEEIHMPEGTQNGCNNSAWGDAFQILKSPLLGEETGLVPVSGNICRSYNESSSKWDTLIFEIDENDDILSGGDYIDIVIRPTPALRGANSGEELAPGSGEQVRAWVIPIDFLLDFLQ